MPYQIEWLVDKRVILTIFSGVVTQRDFEHFMSDLSRYLDQGTPLIHHISNSLMVEKIELSLRTLQILLKAVKLSDQIGWQIDINRNPANRMLAGFASQFARVRSRTFVTYEDAAAFLKENDDTLAGLEWKDGVHREATHPLRPAHK